MVSQILDYVKIPADAVPLKLDFLSERWLWCHFAPINKIPIGHVHDELKFVMPEFGHGAEISIPAGDHFFSMEKLEHPQTAAEVIHLAELQDWRHPIEPINLIFGLLSVSKNLNDGFSNIFVVKTTCERTMLFVVSGRDRWTIKLRSAQFVDRKFQHGSRVFFLHKG